MGSGFTGRKTTLVTEVRPILWLFFNAPNLGSKRIYQHNASQALNCSGLSRKYKNLLRKLWNNETHTYTQRHVHGQHTPTFTKSCSVES